MCFLLVKAFEGMYKMGSTELWFKQDQNDWAKKRKDTQKKKKKKKKNQHGKFSLCRNFFSNSHIWLLKVLIKVAT